MIPSPSVLWFLTAGYLVMVAFFIIQRLLRKTKSARSFRGDRGNMVLIGSVTGAGLCLPLLLDFLGIAILPIGLGTGLAAIVVMCLGVALRAWAAVTLGEFYTTTLMVTGNQKVVDTGPYAVVRHPGYLGEVLIWTGFGVLTCNLLLIFLLPAIFVAAYVYRISVEEKMLVRELGDAYAQYRRKTWRLLPFIY